MTMSEIRPMPKLGVASLLTPSSFDTRRRCKSGEVRTEAGQALLTLAQQTLLTVPRTVHRNARSAPTTPESQRKMLPHYAGSTSNLERLGTHSKTSFEKQNSSPDLLKIRPKSLSNEMSPRFSKSNIKFHKCFKDAPSSEIAFDSFSCALVADLLLQGHLFISENWFCFYSKILGREKQIEIPVRKVRSITRKKTAFFIPNAIKVTTEDGKYLFGSLISRDAAYKLMVFVWKNSGNLDVVGDKDDSDENSIDISPENIIVPDTRPTFNLNGDNVSTDMSQMSEEGSELHSNTDITSDICLNSGSGLQGYSETRVNGTQTKDEIDSCPGTDVSWCSQVFHKVKNCLKLNSINQRFDSFNLQSPQQKMSVLLVVCSFLVIILLISGIILSYKIIALEAQMSGDLWTAQQEQSSQWDMYSDIFKLNDKLQTANINHLHTAIEAHMVVLKQMQENLKMMANSWSGGKCERVHDET